MVEAPIILKVTRSMNGNDIKQCVSNDISAISMAWYALSTQRDKSSSNINATNMRRQAREGGVTSSDAGNACKQKLIPLLLTIGATFFAIYRHIEIDWRSLRRGYADASIYGTYIKISEGKHWRRLFLSNFSRDMY